MCVYGMYIYSTRCVVIFILYIYILHIFLNRKLQHIVHIIKGTNT